MPDVQSLLMITKDMFYVRKSTAFRERMQEVLCGS